MSTPQQPRRKLGGKSLIKCEATDSASRPGRNLKRRRRKLVLHKGNCGSWEGFFSSFGGGNTPCHSSFFCSPATSAHLEQCRAHFFLGGGGGQASNLCLSFLWDSPCRLRCQRDRNRIVGPLFSART